jgi:phage terminase small subunit
MRIPGIIRTERLSPPADLNDDERAVFLNVVSNTAADHFKPSDLVLLSAYCRAVVREREASEHLATHGTVSIDNKLSSWSTVQVQAIKQVMALARMLKLTPLARRPNPLRPGKTAVMSYYDEMRMARLAQTEADDD